MACRYILDGVEYTEDEFKQQFANEYAQRKAVQNSIDKLVQTQKEWRVNNEIDPATQQEKHLYEKSDSSGNVIKTASVSVTGNLDKSGVEKHIKNISDKDKKFNLSVAKAGTVELHQTLESIFKWFTDDDHKLIGTPTKALGPVTQNKVVLDKLMTFAIDLLSKYDGKDVWILPEFIVADEGFNRGKGICGTLDLKIVFPDGSYDKYDWKGVRDLSGKGRVDMERRTSWKAQSNELSRISAEQYGLSDRRMDMMIPFNMIGKRVDDTFVLEDIEVTPADFSQLDTINKMYLEPVVVHFKESDDDALDTARQTLDSAIKHILTIRATGDKTSYAIAVNKAAELQQALFNILFRKDVSLLPDVMLTDIRTVYKVIKERDFSTTLGPEIERMEKFWSPSSIFLEKRIRELDERINELLGQSGDEAESELITLRYRQSEFDKVIREVAIALDKAKKFFTEFAVEMGVKAFGTNTNAALPESEINFTQRELTLMSQVNITNLQTATQINHEAITQYQLKSEEYAHEIIADVEAMKKEFNTPLIDVYKKNLLEKGKNGEWKLIQPVKTDFFTERQKAIDTFNVEWFKNNTRFDQERYDKDLTNLRERLQSEVDARIHSVTFAEKTIQEFIEKWNPENFTNTKAFFIGEEGDERYNKYLLANGSWKSDALHTIEKSPSLKKFYNDILGYNKLLAERGAIRDGQVSTFFPFVGTALSQAYQQGAELGMLDRFSDYISDDPSKKTSELLNPATLEPIRDLTIPFLHPMDNINEQSADVGLSYRMLTDRIAYFDEMVKVQAPLEHLITAEQSKGMVVKNKKSGKFTDVRPDNTTNYIFMKQMTDFMMYGITPTSGPALKWHTNAITKALKIAGKETSAIDIVRFILAYNTVLRLGLKATSIAAGMVGGTSNLFILAKDGKYFTTKQLIKAEGLVISRDKEALQLLDLFKPFVENTVSRKLDKAAAATTLVPTVMHIGMSGLHLTDEQIQAASAIALLQNHMFDPNGNIISIKRAVLESPEAQGKTWEEKEKMMGEWADTKSIFATKKVGKDGKLYWEDSNGNKRDITKPTTAIQSPLTQVQRMAKEVANKVVGAVSQDDKTGLSLKPFVGAFTQFRGFIFGLARARTGRLQYQPYSKTYIKGRWRSFGQLFKSLEATLNVLFSGVGGDEFAPAVETQAEKAYWEDKETYERDNPGKKFDMNKDEYFHNYVGTLQSLFREVGLALGFFVMLALIRPSKNDDEDTKRRSAYLSKYFKKFYNELTFLIDPREFEQLFGNSVPAVGLLTDMRKFLGALYTEMFGDDEEKESAHAFKRFLEFFPLTKQTEDVVALFDDQFREEWGIKSNTQNVY